VRYCRVTEKGQDESTLFIYPKEIGKIELWQDSFYGVRNRIWGDWKRFRYDLEAEGEFDGKNFTVYPDEDRSITINDRETEELFKNQIYGKMKYIVIRSEDGTEYIYVFQKHIDHNAMIECILDMHYEHIKQEFDGVVSAGFVDSDLICHGKSDTLGKASRKEDTALLKKQMS
jgi:hypothetical protein